MDWRFHQRTAAYLIPLACLAFFFAASFGVMHIGMKTDDRGHMHDCPFMGIAAICDMTPFQHISAWQNIYATVILKDTFTALFYALVLCFAWRTLFGAKPFYIRQTIPIRHSEDAELLFYSRPLKEALMRGIVHPKVY